MLKRNIANVWHKYLELFNRDLELTLDYISNILCNESASQNLKADADNKIIKIRKNLYIFSNHIGMIVILKKIKVEFENYFNIFQLAKWTKSLRQKA